MEASRLLRGEVNVYICFSSRFMFVFCSSDELDGPPVEDSDQLSSSVPS